MKKNFIILHRTIILTVIILMAFTSMGQVVPSDCTAADSIVTKYKDDADRLALRKIYRQNLSFKDSIHIPQIHSDTVLDALIAVYNATTLQARDTVVAMFEIHSFPDFVMNSIQVAADSNLFWMQQLKNGILPTGDTTVDNLINAHYLSIDSYYNHFNFFWWHHVVFKSDSNFNLTPLTVLFNAIPGVYISEINGMCCDGNNIWDSIYTDHIELIYSLGWGDCPLGCNERRFWKFNVYFDCSVEFVGSYGNPLPITGINIIDKKSITVSPNPFKEFIAINGISKEFTFTFTNLFGQVLIKEKTTKNRLDNLDGLTSGLYFLTIQAENQTATFKLVKK